MKKIAVFIVCILIFMLLPQYMNNAKADENDGNNKYEQELEKYRDLDYIIKNYDMDIEITENNVYKIKETLQVYFNIDKHGIIRNIPLKNTLKRTDGTSSNVIAKIKNINVNNEYEVSKDVTSCEIKIGSEDELISGEQTYVIEYLYDLGSDPSLNYDEVYFNIIGTEWDVAIENVTFNIKMPKDFDVEKIGFSVGKEGMVGYSTESDRDSIEYEVTNNEISGKLKGFLEPYKGITIRTELPEGYFIKRDNTEDIIDYLIYVIPIVGLIVAFILWFIYGRDVKVKYKMECYPPEGYNSLQVAYIYKGYISNEDVVSLLVYLADKGYIRIEELGKEQGFPKGTIRIIKLYDYDGNDLCEQRFMDGLFRYGRQEVTLSELKDKFYRVVESISRYITSEENSNKFFESNTTTKSMFVALSIVVSLFTMALVPMRSFVSLGEIIGLAFVLLIMTPFVLIGLAQGMKISSRIIWLGTTLFFVVIFLTAFNVFDVVLCYKFYTIGWIVGTICIVGMGICFKDMKKRTPLGTELYGKIKGFRQFLKQSKKSMLTEMVNVNPTYFYNVLPYTYVLGISNKWIKKFGVIGIAPPVWYNDYYGDFSIYRFGRFMNNTMTRANTSLTSSPSSGGSSGGGYSGGGSGGGGGSSW